MKKLPDLFSLVSEQDLNLGRPPHASHSTLTILYHLRKSLGDGMGEQDRTLEFLGPLDIYHLNIIQDLPRTPNRGQLKGERTQECEDIIWLIRTKTLF